MANGSVVNVDANVHSDLAVAMRGGGSQFGKFFPNNKKPLVTTHEKVPKD